MIHEHESVALTHDISEFGLKEGDVGAVVHCYPDSKAFEVEFMKTGGDTIAVLTLDGGDVRPLQHEEILHVRKVAI